MYHMYTEVHQTQGHLPCITTFLVFYEHILNNLEQSMIFFLIWKSLGRLITFSKVTAKSQDLNPSLSD